MVGVGWEKWKGLAVLVMVPAAFALAVNVTDAVPFTLRFPKEQVTVPALLLQLPGLAEAETKLKLAGMLSVTVTPAPVAGPRFVTVIV